MDPNWDSARRRLFDLITEKGVKLAELSRALGKNSAYVQQYLQRGSPTSLREDDRLRLARYFNVNPDEFRIHKGEDMPQPSAADTETFRIAIIATLVALTEGGRSLDDFSLEDIAGAILRTYIGLLPSRRPG